MQAHRKYDFRNQSFAGEQGRLIPLLQQAQEQEGYLSREGQRLRCLRVVPGLRHIWWHHWIRPMRPLRVPATCPWFPGPAHRSDPSRCGSADDC